MKEELQERLCAEFPHLYGKSFHFEVLDGWFELLYELSYTLTRLIRRYECVGHSYNELDQLDEFICGFTVSQVKEKYGTLRFYMESSTKEMNELISQYEKKSEFVCEVCGKPGKLVGKTWYSTRCSEHES